jgi:hypothetical protein
MEGMNCSTVEMRVERKKVLYDWNGSIEKLSGRDQCRQFPFQMFSKDICVKHAPVLQQTWFHVYKQQLLFS